MKTIEVELIGETPLLMHRCANMEESAAKKNPAKNYDAKEEAEKVAYRNSKGNLIIPSRCIKGCLLGASSWFKFGKKSAKPLLAGCVRINPVDVELLDLKDKTIKDYIIDKRPVVVQRNRIIRYRPRLDEWKLKFEIIYNEQLIADTDLIQTILEESGQRVGLLDNRPQRYGECGCFKVSKFIPKK